MIIEQFTDLAGKIRVKWLDENTQNVYMFKFESEPTSEQIAKAVAQAIEIEELSQLDTIGDFSALKEVVIDIVTRLKEKPNITFTQYSNYLTTLEWKYALQIRCFVLDAASKIAERKNVDISNRTERQIFEYFQAYIQNFTLRKLAKIFLNQFDL